MPPRDEVFHGGNPTEGVALTAEVACVDTLMHSGRRAHGAFRLHYSDTVLTTGNGRIWADWAATGLRPGVLFGLPYIGFLAQRHRLPLVFGWLGVTLEIGGEAVTAYRVSSWYEADAIPVSHFSGGSWQARAWCSAVPGETRLVLNVTVTGVPEATLVLRGGSTLGEEAGSPHDAVNGTVGSHPRLPAELSADVREWSRRTTRATSACTTATRRRMAALAGMGVCEITPIKAYGPATPWSRHEETTDDEMDPHGTRAVGRAGRHRSMGRGDRSALRWRRPRGLDDRARRQPAQPRVLAQ